MIYKGGKLYDEGEYGCVFTPPLLCKNEKKMLGELPENDEIEGAKLDKLLKKSEAEAEFAVSKYIQQIPLWKNYFIVSESMCEPAPKQTDSDIGECDIIQNKPLSQFRLLRMTFGGIPLSLYKTRVTEFPYIDIFKHMLEGVSLLTLFGIVHRDLHQGNILIDDKQVPRIIDFNLSLNTKNDIKVADMRHMYAVKPFQEPPDSTLLNAISLGKRPSFVIDDVINNKPILKRINSLLGISMMDMRKDLNDFYSNSVSAQTGDYLKWFKTYWRVIDSWAVGANFVELATKMMLWPEFAREWNGISKQVVPILKKMCAINPIERIDCIQALAKLDPQNYIVRKYTTGWLDRVGRGGF